MDFKGHNLKYPENIQKKRDITEANGSLSFIADDGKFSVLCKKTERLASAVYLITDFFSDKEPVKWFLRRGVLQIISKTTSLKKTPLSEQSKNLMEEVKLSILKTTSLLETAYMGGLVSDMNYTILSREFANLVRMGDSYVEFLFDGSKRQENAINSDFFNVSVPESEQDYIGHYKRQKEQDNVLYNKDGDYKKDRFQKENFGVKGSREKSLADIDKEKSKEKKNKRQVKIIDIIKDRKEVSIKDISSIIKDCSEKTIQRELTSMVDSGILRKRGDRRWSRYFLNL